MRGPARATGLEDTLEHSGEICVVEIFGDAVRDGSAAVGVGVKNFRDPRLSWDFAADRQPIDVAGFHTYAVDWRPGSVTFFVDGAPVRRVDRSPDYPVQLMLGVFDFPAKADPAAPDVPVPQLVVSHVTGRPLAE